MAIGIQKSKEVVIDFTDLVLVCVGVYKDFSRGGVFSAIGKVLKLAGVVKEIMEDLPAALPEFKDLDSAEVGELGALAYESVLKIAAAIAERELRKAIAA